MLIVVRQPVPGDARLRPGRAVGGEDVQTQRAFAIRAGTLGIDCQLDILGVGGDLRRVKFDVDALGVGGIGGRAGVGIVHIERGGGAVVFRGIVACADVGVSGGVQGLGRAVSKGDDELGNHGAGLTRRDENFAVGLVEHGQNVGACLVRTQVEQILGVVGRGDIDIVQVVFLEGKGVLACQIDHLTAVRGRRDGGVFGEFCRVIVQKLLLCQGVVACADGRLHLGHFGEGEGVKEGGVRRQANTAGFCGKHRRHHTEQHRRNQKTAEKSFHHSDPFRKDTYTLSQLFPKFQPFCALPIKFYIAQNTLQIPIYRTV